MHCYQSLFGMPRAVRILVYQLAAVIAHSIARDWCWGKIYEIVHKTIIYLFGCGMCKCLKCHRDCCEDEIWLGGKGADVITLLVENDIAACELGHFVFQIYA